MALSASPRYSAVVECVPTASLDVTRVATLPLSVADPILFPPSMNFTVPVSVGPPDVTVAVNVTACPSCEGFRLELSAVVVEFHEKAGQSQVDSCWASLNTIFSPAECALSTSITWERTPHPVRRPAFSSHLV